MIKVKLKKLNKSGNFILILEIYIGKHLIYITSLGLETEIKALQARNGQ